MRLFHEYESRRCFSSKCAVHVRKGFVYLRGGSELLSIRWNEVGPHPGFYTLSECVLDTACRTIRSHKVVWDEYETRLVEILTRAAPVVSDPNMVFYLTWEYFVRKHEFLFAGCFPLSRIARTLDSSNPSRLADCLDALEDLGRTSPAAVNFWHSKAFSVIDSYCYWAARF